MACLKKWFFGKPSQSRKWIEIVDNFKAQITCLKNLKFWRTDSVYKKIDCMKKKIGNQFGLWSKLEKIKIFTTEIACSKNSTFLQTDSVFKMNWLASSSNSVLRKLNFS